MSLSEFGILTMKCLILKCVTVAALIWLLDITVLFDLMLVDMIKLQVFA